MEFILLATAHFLALLSPGPDFFLIIRTSLQKTLKHAIALSAGIAIANGVYIIIAILGLEVIKSFPWLLITLKYAGATFLLLLAFMLMKSTKLNLIEKSSTLEKTEGKMINDFILGFLSGLLNPKNIIFYLSLFSVMVSVDTHFVTRVLYGVWMITIVFIWDVGLSIMIGNNRIKAKISHWMYAIEKLSSIVLAGFAIFLIFHK